MKNAFVAAGVAVSLFVQTLDWVWSVSLPLAAVTI